jgi:hypothetical protein
VGDHIEAWLVGGSWNDVARNEGAAGILIYAAVRRRQGNIRAIMIAQSDIPAV